jgi:hypothetical protein
LLQHRVDGCAQCTQTRIRRPDERHITGQWLPRSVGNAIDNGGKCSPAISVEVKQAYWASDNYSTGSDRCTVTHHARPQHVRQWLAHRRGRTHSLEQQHGFRNQFSLILPFRHCDATVMHHNCVVYKRLALIKCDVNTTRPSLTLTRLPDTSTHTTPLHLKRKARTSRCSIIFALGIVILPGMIWTHC